MRAELVNRNEVIENTELMTYVSLKIRSKDLGEIPTPLDVEFKKFFDDRTKDQNSKYWVNLKRLAKALDVSITELHNQMLIDYGTYEQDEYGNLIKVVMKDDFDYMRSSDLHLFPTKYTTELDGKTYRLFYKIKSSSQYNSQEFSKLLEGLLNEMKQAEVRSE